ncbi:MAG: hypothetical protein LBV29_03035 [Azoarcus sp.]|jgi:hypothetical protein|nr:hypothetical protein [Azoarcus sp.]
MTDQELLTLAAKSTAHPHAENMRLYAEDAAETDKPWIRWECGFISTWEDLTRHPQWDIACMYRRKPRTVLINGIEVPEPLREAPPVNDNVYVVSPASDPGIVRYSWREEDFMQRWLALGLLHLTEEAARQHVEALIAPTKQAAA